MQRASGARAQMTEGWGGGGGGLRQGEVGRDLQTKRTYPEDGAICDVTAQMTTP